jgi:hypothetical protein
MSCVVCGKHGRNASNPAGKPDVARKNAKRGTEDWHRAVDNPVSTNEERSSVAL